MSTSYLLCLCRVQMKSLLLYCLGPVTWEELDITCHNINTIFIIFSSDNDLDYRRTWDGEFVPFYFLLVSKNLKIGIVHLVYSSKRLNSQFPHASHLPSHHLVSDVVESAEHVRGGAEELHAAALLVLELGRDGGPVRYQPDGEILS